MIKLLRTATIAVFALLLGVGLAGAPANADVNIRAGKAADLSVAAANPSTAQLERQYAGFWNPNVPVSPKYAASYRGNTPKVQQQIKKVLANSRTMDFFSIQGRLTSKTINGNRMTARGNGVMAGFPAQGVTMEYIRDGGLWKFDWKAYSQSNGLKGLDWGY